MMVATQKAPDMRRYGIGASQVAAALDLHPYHSRIGLWQELTGAVPPFAGNEITEWGNELEPVIRRKYSRNHRVTLYVPAGPSFHAENDWARCTPDALVLAEDEKTIVRGLEVKTAGYRQAWRWGDTLEHVPVEYLCQCAWSMYVTGLPRWDLAVLIGGQDYREYSIKRDDEFIAEIVPEVKRFWEVHVLAGEPPEVDGTDAYSEFIAARYPHVRDEYKQADAEIEKLVDRLKGIREDIAAADVEKKLVENLIKKWIGDAAGMDSAQGRFTYKPQGGNVKPDYEEICKRLCDRLSLSTEERMALMTTITTTTAKTRPLRTPRQWSQKP